MSAADIVLRTPDERFAHLPDFPFPPHTTVVDGLRISYVDHGAPEAPPVVMLHGEPSWSFLYRKMIPPIAAAGLRALAPDLVGFGRSDKLARKEDHSHARHVALMRAWVRQLGLRDITLFVQDWGGLIGLRVVAEEPDRFARIVVANTGLPDAPPLLAPAAHFLFRRAVRRQGRVSREDVRERMSFLRWVAYAQQEEDMPVSEILQAATLGELPPEVLAAYDAPFPDRTYKAGPHAMPPLVPSELGANRRAWRVLERLPVPVLCAFSDGDPITRGGERAFRKRLPGARGQEHVTIRGAGHFLQEDRPEELAQAVIRFVERTAGARRADG